MRDSSIQRSLAGITAARRGVADMRAEGFDGQLTYAALDDLEAARDAVLAAAKAGIPLVEPDSPGDPPPDIPVDDSEPPFVDPPDLPDSDVQQEIAAVVAGIPHQQHGEIMARVYNGRWEMQDGSGGGISSHPITAAWKACVERYHDQRITLGIAEDFVQQRLDVGTAHNVLSPALIGSAERPVDVDLVALGGVRGIEHIKHGSKWALNRHFGLYGFDIHGGPDSFIWRITEPIGELVMVGCSLKKSRTYTASQLHTSGIHADAGVELFYMRNHRYGGDAEGRFREHNIYAKGFGPCYILDSDLRGGGVTFFQTRAHDTYYYPQWGQIPATAKTTGLMVVSGCIAESPGWEHEQPGGGSLLTFWEHEQYPVYVLDCTVRNARKGIMVAAYQGADRSWAKDGLPHRRIVMRGNDFASSPQTDRHAVSISGARDVVFAGGNRFDGGGIRAGLMIDDPWSINRGAAFCASIAQEGEDFSGSKIVKGPGSPFDIESFKAIKAAGVQHQVAPSTPRR